MLLVSGVGSIGILELALSIGVNRRAIYKVRSPKSESAHGATVALVTQWRDYGPAANYRFPNAH